MVVRSNLNDQKLLASRRQSGPKDIEVDGSPRAVDLAPTRMHNA